MIFADAIGDEDQIKALVDAVPVPVSVNMGLVSATGPPRLLSP
jgi:2-methylisocitrate lyase-like PEP mutase family enzyme